MVDEVAIGAETRLSFGCLLRFACLFAVLAFLLVFLVILLVVYGMRATARTVHLTGPRQAHPCSLSAFCLARITRFGRFNQ